MNTVLEKQGDVTWTELMTSDPDAAKAFYGSLFGWQYDQMPMANGMNYTVVSANGKQIGGIMGQCETVGDMPPAWGSYVTVTDVDGTARKVAELGGKIMHGPEDIPDVGRFCVIQDPQGAMISIITPLAG